MNKRIITLSLFILMGSLIAVANDSPINNKLDRPAGYWSTLKDESNTGIFNALTEPKSQREDWYAISPYIAEFGCTISNIGFFLVAANFASTAPIAAAGLAIAGTASAISHAIPKQYLNTVDKIGAASSVVAVAYDCNLFNPTTIATVVTNPYTAIPLAATGAIYATDIYINRAGTNRKSSDTWVHIAWHLLAATTAYTLLASR